MVLSQGQLGDGQHFQTIRAFLDGQDSNVSSGFSTLALRVKASALFERADRLSACLDPRKCFITRSSAIKPTSDTGVSSSSAFREESQKLERAIARFTSTLIPPHQLDATTPEARHALIVIHSLANASMIHLCYRFSQTDPILYDKSLQAARACAIIIKYVANSDFDFLDPIIGVSYFGPLLNSLALRHDALFLAVLDFRCRGTHTRAEQ